MQKAWRIVTLGIILFFSDTTEATSIKTSEVPCRCGDGDGPCALTPLLKRDSNIFFDIKITKSKEQAYILTEETKLKKDSSILKVEQGGCNHPYTSFEFQLKDRHVISDRNYFLKKLKTLLKSTSEDVGAQLSDILGKLIALSKFGATGDVRGAPSTIAQTRP